MLTVLALIACSSDPTASLPPPLPLPPVPPVDVVNAPIPAILLADSEPPWMPVGQAKVRDCWSSGRGEVATRKSVAPTPKKSSRPSSSPMGPSAGVMAPEAPSAAPPPMAAPAMPSAAPQMADSSSVGSGMGILRGAEGGGGTRDLGALGTKGDADDGARAPGKAAASSEVAAAAPAPVATTTAAPMPADKPMPDPAPAERFERAKDEEKSAAEPVEEYARPRTPEPQFDWGGTTWLSNDDSMSLASAQHVLHDVKHGRTPNAGEIRPHELLNYFSFDTEPPAEGRLFSVVPSAEKTGDETLTVALAVKGATPPRRPMDVTFVVDRSGSMSAEGRMAYVKRALTLASEQLVTGDRVDVVLFDNDVCTPLEDYVVGRDAPTVLANTISRMAPEGGTNIGIGLKEAYRLVADPARATTGRRNRRVMLLTDAQVNQGMIDGDALGLVAEGYEKYGVRLTGVGVGEGFNDHILDTVTERGRGAYVYLGSEAVVDRLFGVGFRSLVETIAHDVQFELKLPPSLAMERFYGEESSTDKADIQPIHYFTGTTQLFLQDLKVDPRKLGPNDAISLTIHYKDVYTDQEGTQQFSWHAGELLQADRHNLDKARALMSWTDLLLADAMGGDACGAPLVTWGQRAGKVSDDAEISYVHTLVQKTCPATSPLSAPSLARAGVPFKVRVDADVPIAEVELWCASVGRKERLSAGSNIAKFDATPGACELTLQGNVPMTARVQVPSTGGDVKCMVRGGRMSCG